MKYIFCLYAFILFTLVATAQDDKAVSYKELQKHLPDKVADFTAIDEPEGQSMSMNGMSYSAASQGYMKGDVKMTISLMDYKGAGSLYTAAAMAWTTTMEYEDDEQKVSGFKDGDFHGLISVGKEYKEVSLTTGYKGRYLIQIEVQGSDNEAKVKEILKKLSLADLP